MKQLHKTLLTAVLCAGSLLPLHAQEAIQRILEQIETNNHEIRAAVGTTTAQKLENRAANNLPNPSLSYSHLWDSDDKNITVGELVISQGFDFPTLYAARRRGTCSFIFPSQRRRYEQDEGGRQERQKRKDVAEQGEGTKVLAREL